MTSQLSAERSSLAASQAALLDASSNRSRLEGELSGAKAQLTRMTDTVTAVERDRAAWISERESMHRTIEHLQGQVRPSLFVKLITCLMLVNQSVELT